MDDICVVVVVVCKYEHCKWGEIQATLSSRFNAGYVLPRTINVMFDFDPTEIVARRVSLHLLSRSHFAFCTHLLVPTVGHCKQTRGVLKQDSTEILSNLIMTMSASLQ